MGPDKESENKEELDQKVSALKCAMEQAAEAHLEKTPKNEQNHKRSEVQRGTKIWRREATD